MVSLKQEFRQAQQLTMTSQLQQSIKLLQLSAVELQEYIDIELEKNPLLSREEAESEVDAKEVKAEEPEQQKEVEVSDTDYSAAESLDDSDYSNDYSEGMGELRVSAGTHTGGAFSDDGEEGFGIDSASARDKTLREYLLEQIHVDITDPAQLLIAEKLTDMIDDAGYLREDITKLADLLGTTKEEIDAVITKLQQCEPVGVFARSLTECLKLQLADMDRLDPVMETFLHNIEMMGQGDLAGLRRKCDVDEEDFTQLIADIRRCNPKPGAGFAAEDSFSVIPDVVVRRGKSGAWLVELNPDALPRVLINRQYAAEVGTKNDKEAKKFLSGQLATANWLVKALDQRAQTILKVSQEIVKQQEKFLLHGIRFLKPLVLKDIANAIGMHESTVSRVTTAKYMATPRGTLELKYFFTSSIGASTGADFSSKTVMFYIKELVDEEDPKKILSDDAIVKLLKDRNIDVARRTVTKYREEMHIPSSVVRRRQKAAV